MGEKDTNIIELTERFEGRLRKVPLTPTRLPEQAFFVAPVFEITDKTDDQHLHDQKIAHAVSEVCDALEAYDSGELLLGLLDDCEILDAEGCAPDELRQYAEQWLAEKVPTLYQQMMLKRERASA